MTRLGPLYGPEEYFLEMQHDGRVDIIVDGESRGSEYGLRLSHLIGDALASGLVARAFDGQ